MPSPRYPHPRRHTASPRRDAAPSSPRRPDAPDAPRSAAWLQAEQLFSAPAANETDPALAVAVTVKRARVNLPDPEAQPLAAQIEGSEGAEKAPRVFRVELPANETPAASVDAAPPVSPAPAAPVRSRRLAAHKRPGPVLQVFVAPQAEPLDLEEAAALRHLLADLDPALTDIERAGSFQFIDDALVRRWRSLARELDDLQTQVHGLLERAQRTGHDVSV